MAQTFLDAAQVDELVVAYAAGVSVPKLAERYSVHHTTVVAHLKRRSVSLRRRGLTPAQADEAVVLYRQGSTLMEIGVRFGVSQGTVGRAVVKAGYPLRPPGRRTESAP